MANQGNRIVPGHQRSNNRQYNHQRRNGYSSSAVSTQNAYTQTANPCIQTREAYAQTGNGYDYTKIYPYNQTYQYLVFPEDFCNIQITYVIPEETAENSLSNVPNTTNAQSHSQNERFYSFPLPDNYPDKNPACQYSYDFATTIPDRWFYNRADLYVAMLGPGITTLRHEAFYQCPNLKQIFLPEGLVTIGYKSLYGCSSIEHIDLPSTLTFIYSEAFDGCAQLKSLSIHHTTLYSVFGFLMDEQYPESKTPEELEYRNTHRLHNMFYSFKTYCAKGTCLNRINVIGRLAADGTTEIKDIVLEPQPSES